MPPERGEWARPGRGAGVLAASLLLLCRALPSQALLGDVRGTAGLDGSVRSIVGVTRNYDFDPFFGGDRSDLISQTLLRLTLAGRPRPHIAYELHAVGALDYSSASVGGGATPLAGTEGDARYRALDVTWLADDTAPWTSALWIDRASATVRIGRADLTVGRQAITFGKAYFWSPLDVFLPFDPRQFDRDYKPGVDAVRLDLALGAFSGINLVAAAGRTIDALGGAQQAGLLDATWFGSSVLARAFTTVEGWDLALQGGKIFGGYQIGAAGVGEIGPIELRLEAATFFADDSPALLPTLPLGPLAGEKLVEDSTAVVMGLGHRFENSLTLEFEYFFNGGGDSDNLDASLLRLRSGGLLNLNEHLCGGLVSYEILPILVGQIAAIVALDDGSGQVQPSVVWSAGDEIEVVAGAIVNWGARPDGASLFAPGLRSEFGSYPDFFYVEPKLYF